MATNFRVKIGKVGRLIFVRCLVILKWITISPFWFLKVHLWRSGYIVRKFGELRSSNSGGLRGIIGVHTSHQNHLRQIIPGSRLDRMVGIHRRLRIWPSFYDRTRDVAIATNLILASKLAKSAYSPLFVALAFRTDYNIAILVFKS